MNYLSLIQVGLGMLNFLIPALTNNKAPIEVISAVQSAVDALEQHKDDMVTRLGLEKNRG
jgi:hypothetical protein